MTKNRATKKAVHEQMKTSGEPYTLAARNHQVLAWDDEDSRAIIYGTHDPKLAQETYQRYLREDCGFKPGDWEWSPDADDLKFYEGMSKLWTLPKDLEEQFDMFREPGPGRVPFMFATLG